MTPAIRNHWRATGSPHLGFPYLCRSAFTLIEVLVVMVIALVLAGIAVFSWSSISQNTVAATARQLNSQVRLTRSYAVAKREYVALLLPTAANMGAISDNDLKAFGVSDYADQTVRPCIVSISGGTVTFESYIKGGEWNHLPKGVIVDVTPTTSLEDCTLVPFPEDTAADSEDITVKCIVFKPTGQLNVAQNVTLACWSSTAEQTGKTESKVNLSINWLTGKVSYVE